MANREKDGGAYYWRKSTIFDDSWIVVKREVVADFDSEYAAKRVAKELNNLKKDAS